MTTNVSGQRVHDKAKIASLQELIGKHQSLFNLLRSGWVVEVRDREPELSSKQVHDRVRARAVADLIEMFAEEYLEIRLRWTAHFRATLGWTDNRPRANVERGRAQLRNDGGRWSR